MTPPVLQKLVIKKMAAKGGRIDLMFLAPPPTLPLDPLLQHHRSRQTNALFAKHFVHKTMKMWEAAY